MNTFTTTSRSITCKLCMKRLARVAGQRAEARNHAAEGGLAAVDFGEPRCVHENYERPEDRTNPAQACQRKQPNQSAGVFSDEGCIDAFDCAVSASNEAARLNAEEEPADAPLYRWELICPDHEDQPQKGCEVCAADDGHAVDARVVEGVIVAHAGTAEGSLPQNTVHPDVIAARIALHPMLPATLTDHSEVTDPDEADPQVRGYMIDPRGGGRVAVYWIEAGLAVRRDDPLHGPSLDAIGHTLHSKGWRIEPILRGTRCFFAWRPDADNTPA
ncbi:hypothetical protein ABGB09_29585 [Streptomyces sp. B8F3]|uniref:hypothetical protein n=1 Tax=Streptomyces sp. B8F3 TaxID=3153573 RepID=UPI00325CD11B